VTCFCGCNWNLGVTCYLHVLAHRVERLAADPSATQANRDTAKAALDRQQALYDAAVSRR